MAAAPHRLTRALAKAHPVVFSAYAIAAAFTCYLCMYAFRKAFAAGTFPGQADLPLVGAIDLKILFIVAQVLGYCLSKFAGFMIYVTDAFGYLGSVGLLLYKNFGQAQLSWLEFFVGFSYVTSILCSLCFVGALIYFARQSRAAVATRPESATAHQPGG